MEGGAAQALNPHSPTPINALSPQEGTGLKATRPDKAARKETQLTVTLSIEPIELSKLTLDGYQRDYKPEHSRKIASNFDIAQWNYPKVVETAGGQYRIVAGQHRVKAAIMLASSGKWPFDTAPGTIMCQLVRGFTTIEEEARLFINDSRNTRNLVPYDKHKGLLAAKDRQALDIQRALDLHGIPLVKRQKVTNGHAITAVGALYNIWLTGGYPLLDETLAVIAAWPAGDPFRCYGYLVGGLALVINQKMASKTYSRSRFIARMASVNRQPTTIHGNARKTAARNGLAPNSYLPYADVIRK